MVCFVSGIVFLSIIGSLNVTGFFPHFHFHSVYGLDWATGCPHMGPHITLRILMIEAHI